LKTNAVILSLFALFLSGGILASDPGNQKFYLNGEKKYEMERFPGQVVRITTYYRNGQVKEIGHYKRGKRHGWFQSFDSDGVKRTVAFFQSDKKDGFWTFYYPNGEIHRHVFFKNNKVLQLEEFNLVETRTEYDYY
jgi:antitoxin component YwqK of YwqJK toxin-antitoxin module